MVALAVVAALGLWLRRAENRVVAVAIGAIAGGAVGNVIDRIRFGWVVDFIDVSMRWGGREHHWPTFNVADIAITLGVVILVLILERK